MSHTDRILVLGNARQGFARRFGWALIGFGGFCGLALGAEVDLSQLPPPVDRPVTFVADVLPLLQERCYECHGSKKQSSGFRLDQAAAALQGGDNGTDIIPGKSAASPLVHFVARLVPEMEMPPKGPPLTAEEIGIIRTWIDQGAHFPAVAGAVKAEDPLDWWSLRPLAKVRPPSAASLLPGWNENTIDQFVAARLAENGLTPSPPADRRTLIRRATYDLHGLPPTPAEVEAFLNDPRPDAYDQLIERLLASPRYGEQWGRHWLDVVRFGESRGYERNEIINTAWPFRDYIIRSLNEDKPFDQLVTEHLAGDVIGRTNPAVEIGVTFLVAGPYDDVGNQDAAQAKIIRANTVDEIITATSAAFLGLTVNCARCHNHKFDPITAEDYYRFYSAFAGVQHGERPLASQDQRQSREARLAPLQERQTSLHKALTEFDEAILARTPILTNSAAFDLPLVDPHETEDRFEPRDAQWIRLTVLSNNRDPRSASGVRIDEFEVWTAEETPRNVALATAGAKATGPSRRPDDFAEAYAPGLVNDGEYGARWIVDGPAQLTLALAKPERVDRIRFSADRMKSLPKESGEIVFVGEYQVEASLDGTNWTKIADSHRRPPISAAFARERRLQASLTDEDRAQRADLLRELESVTAEIRKVPALPVAWIGKFEQPKDPIHVMKGGDPAKPGAEVRPGSLSTLSRVMSGFELSNETPEGERRLALARWLVSRENPLTVRVLANRLWQYHFGVGLVDTPSDFGKLGSTPTHPELLDWLAHRLHEVDWHIKPMHREIMRSRTYQQSSAWREEAARSDSDARWLWRFPPRRLSAEEIRDTMLRVADVLDERMGGPGFKLYRYLQDNVATYIPLDRPGPETYRRTVYHHTARAARVDLITDFDGPDCAFATPRRVVTTSPLQVLTALNHQFTVDMAQAFAARLEKEAETGALPAQVRRGFLLVCGRPPTEAEVAACLKLAESHGTLALGRALLNLNEAIYLD